MSSQIDLPVFCSVESQKSNLDPSWIKIGDNLDFYLIFEFNQPWDKFVEKSNHFPEGLTEYLQKIKSEGKKFKYFCIKSGDKEIKRGMSGTQVFFYKANRVGFASFERTELILPEDKFLEGIQSLVENQSHIYRKFEVKSDKIRDIFVCTHNERDQCCGFFGVQISKKLKSNNFDQSVRIWQSSHMGGHKVGPTFMDMPSGRMWAYLEEDSVQEIINQNKDHNKFLKNYRGTYGLDRYSQIADKAIFEMKGWDWFNTNKRSEIVSQGEKVTKVKIVYEAKTESGEYLATVIDIGKITLPATQCSKSVSMTKFEIKDLKQFIY
ncbi:MAG: hypothetical protein GPJ54_19500 [Candidatus Heimdallarchaeota archaeon]|nr:hypothetical protein [Candidatus Heimdallarchaeota archaeon]